MGLMKRKLYLSALMLIMMCNYSEAAWQTPQVLIAGGWGSQTSQFGIRYGDSGDTFPRGVIVLNNGDIWIPDGYVNKRLKLYDRLGNMKELITLDEATRTFSKYWFIGIFAGLGMDGTIYTSNYMGKDEYAQFTPTGELLKTYTDRPLELGRVDITERQTDGSYKTVVRYRNATYSVVAPQPFERFSRDNNENLIGYGLVGGEGKGKSVKRVYKFDKCGKELGSLDLPGNDIVEIIHRPPPNVPPPPTSMFQYTAEYGEPVIASNGDVYTWKRSDTNYSILKWSWVNEATDPKGGPDAPEEVQALPSTSGIYLTWNPSPQDPGCVTGYEVERSTSATGIFTNVATVSSDDKQAYNFNDEGATAGATWYYKVKATSEIGDSDAATASAARP